MARVSSNIRIGIKSLKTFILPSMIDLNRVIRNLWLENSNFARLVRWPLTFRAFVNGSVNLNWDSSSLKEWSDFYIVQFQSAACDKSVTVSLIRRFLKWLFPFYEHISTVLHCWLNFGAAHEIFSSINFLGVKYAKSRSLLHWKT